MSSLTFIEKRKFEELFGMKSGYVLDFSDRSFQSFVQEYVGKDILSSRYNYASGSKANRLRAFWQLEDDVTVAKLMGALLDYAEKEGPIELSCRTFVKRLQGVGRTSQPPSASVSDRLEQARARSQVLAELKEAFLKLATMTDRNAAGLKLEKLLNRLFAAFQLRPREPFRVVGEQIDGSFELDSNIYLLESKWENSPLAEAPLLVFDGKIRSKSTFTRGVMIALGGVSAPATDAITRGKTPSFFVMNGYDLIMILSEEMPLDEFLRRRVRLLAEQGRMFVPFSDLRS
jgi:hypothetical protein